ncbi:MAG: type II secretion system protein [Bdellovibrionales bacterium]|nr:type II secretion system protein [Bdellovibrionales bacterium]
MRKFNLKSSQGFTLIEIMIVLAILGFALTMGIGRLTNRSGELRAVLRKTTVLSRELHTRAKLNGVTYRMVIDLGEGGPNSTQSIYVEKGSGASVIKDSEKEAEDLKNLSEEEKKALTKDFTVDSHILKNPLQIPKDVYISEVEINRVEKPMTQGKAYIHYLSQGLVEEAAIHILRPESNQKWTISIHPLTGRAEVLSPSMRLEEMKNQ